MTYLRITPEQLAGAGNSLAREWGGDGYVVETIESPTARVALFRVLASDGRRFTVAVDRFGNCQCWYPPYDSEEDLIAEMHNQASVS